jgi:MFS transporter, DHA2 family, methylenomycin A resistance protein
MMGSTGAPDAGAESRLSRRAVVAVCVAVAVVGINTTAMGVATRGVADELDVSLRALEWIVGAYLVTAAALALVGGRLGDIIGRARTFMIGCGVFVVGCLLAAIAPGAAVLIAARAIQGVGAALVMPASIEVVAAYAPRRGPQRGFRTRGIVYASAFGIGPLIGGVLTDNTSWRTVFWLELVLLLIAMAAARPLLRVPSQLPRAPTHDFLGATLVAVFVFFVVFLASRGRAWGWALWPTAVLMVITLLVGAWAVWVEARTEHPLIHRALLRDRSVIGANVATLGASIGMIGLVYFFSVFAQSALIFDSTALGVAFALLPFTLSIIGFSFVAGFLSRRFGVSGPVIGGLGLSVVGFAWLGMTTVGTAEARLVIPLALCGVGAGVANAGLTTPAVMTNRTRVDEAAGLISLTRFVGSAIAIAIGTATYLGVGGLPRGVRHGRSDAAATVLGGSAYRQAVATLREDLRRPFEAATRSSTVHAFATTMRITALILAVLALVSAVLLIGRQKTVHDAAAIDGP